MRAAIACRRAAALWRRQQGPGKQGSSRSRRGLSGLSQARLKPKLASTFNATCFGVPGHSRPVSAILDSSIYGSSCRGNAQLAHPMWAGVLRQVLATEIANEVRVDREGLEERERANLVGIASHPSVLETGRGGAWKAGSTRSEALCRKDQATGGRHAECPVGIGC